MDPTGGCKRKTGGWLATALTLWVMVCFSWEAANQLSDVQIYHMYRIQDMVMVRIAQDIPRPASAQIGDEVDHCLEITRDVLATHGFYVTAEDMAGYESERSNIVFCNDQACIDKYLKPGQVTGIRKVTGIHLEPDGP